MRVRKPFAAAFGALLLVSAWLGLGDANPTPVNDKALHFLAFFVLTLTGYWAVETSRRNLMKVVPLGAIIVSVVSEFGQALINPNRQFDPADIAANVVGSLLAVGLCSWYHKRMLDRKRKKKMQGYGLVTSDDVADIELGEGPGLSGEGIEGEPADADRDADLEGDGEDDDGGAEAWDSMDAEDTEPSDAVKAKENGKDDPQ